MRSSSSQFRSEDSGGRDQSRFVDDSGSHDSLEFNARVWQSIDMKKPREDAIDLTYKEVGSDAVSVCNR